MTPFVFPKREDVFQNPYRKVEQKPLKDNKILIIFDIPETKRKSGLGLEIK